MTGKEAREYIADFYKTYLGLPPWLEPVVQRDNHIVQLKELTDIQAIDLAFKIFFNYDQHNERTIQ
jgi:hypothetical protein